MRRSVFHIAEQYFTRKAYFTNPKGFISLKRNTPCLSDKGCFFSGGDGGI